MTDNKFHWAQQIRKTITVGARKLCVFSFNGYDCLLESYEVSEILGYKQLSSLRKQTLTDWTKYLIEGTDFVMVHDEKLLELYDELFVRVRVTVKLVPTKPSRGRLFFTPAGMVKVIKRTSKPTTELESALRQRDLLPENQEVPKIRVPKNPAPLHQPSTKSKEDRKFEYEVMQTLINQLERLTEPHLRELSIAAAEIALGRELPHLRAATKTTAPPKKTGKATQPTPAPPRRTTVGPIFTENEYYSMTRIGEKAGGYTAKQAGVAADNVAAGLGYTREQIRKEQLEFNEIAMRPDSTTGKKRPMVRFHKDFANQVIAELRANPQFEPTLTRGIPTLPPFAGGKSYPKLSKGVFDDEEDPTPSASPLA